MVLGRPTKRDEKAERLEYRAWQPRGVIEVALLWRRQARVRVRDLTRYRVSLTEECNRIANRMQRVLENVNIKPAWVATNALGASGRGMIQAIIDGEQNPGLLADMAKGPIRSVNANRRWPGGSALIIGFC